MAGDPMSFWGAHEFRRNPKNRPPKKIPHEDCTAGIKVWGRHWIGAILLIFSAILFIFGAKFELVPSY